MAFAAEKGWPTPVALPADSGATVVELAGRAWTCHRFLEGASVAADTPAFRHITGRLLGRLHRDLCGFESSGQRPGFGKTWELDVMVEPAGMGTFNALLAAFGQEYPELAAAIRRQRYRKPAGTVAVALPGLADHPSTRLLAAEPAVQGGAADGLLDFDFSREDGGCATVRHC